MTSIGTNSWLPIDTRRRAWHRLACEGFTFFDGFDTRVARRGIRRHLPPPRDTYPDRYVTFLAESLMAEEAPVNGRIVYFIAGIPFVFPTVFCMYLLAGHGHVRSSGLNFHFTLGYDPFYDDRDCTLWR